MKKEKGTIVIIASIATAILIAISAYFLNALVVEMKISESMDKAQGAYYLAESGVHEAVWKLKNDSEWSDNFIDLSLNPDPEGNYWEGTLEREDIGGGSYEVRVQNTGPGEAQIYSVANTPFLNRDAQRRARVTVSQPLEAPTDDSSIFSGGPGSNVIINHSKLTINDGNIFSNHNLIIDGKSEIELYDNPDTEKLEGKALAVGNLNVGGSGSIDEYTALCAQNVCTEDCDSCDLEERSIPIVDFDSDSEDSFKSRAENLENNDDCSIFCNPAGESSYKCSDKCLFSEGEFEDLLWEVGEEGVLEIESEVTYVTGRIRVRGARRLNIEGALVADRSIEIGKDEDWRVRGDKDSGYSHVRIENPEVDRASGILSKNKIGFGDYSLFEESVVEGVIYAGDQVKFVSLPEKLTINGAAIGRQLHFTSLWEELEMNFDDELVLYGLGYIVDDRVVEPVFSPVIEVDHWEEVY